MDQAEHFLYRQIQKNKSPSLHYLLFDKDKILIKYRFGFEDLQRSKEADQYTTYNAFSVTKTFTAVAILQLAEKKILDINQPAQKYLSDFPYSSDITIRQLLSHSSGIPNPIPLSWIHLISEHQTFDRNAFFNNIFAKHKKTISEPNEKFAYSNLGYVLLGRIIEEMSGVSYEQYIKENILKRIGLQENELGFEITETGRHAKGYHKNMSFFNLISGFFINKARFMGRAEGVWKPFNNYYLNGPSYGGLIGRPDAFVKYLQEFLKSGNRLLSPDFENALFQENYTCRNKPTAMCLSWFSGELNGRKYFSHAGGGGGYYCEIRIYRDQGIGSVIFFNRTGISDERFLDKVDKFYFRGNSAVN